MKCCDATDGPVHVHHHDPRLLHAPGLRETFALARRRVPLATRRARVLTLLGDHRWHETSEIASERWGGTDGTRRLRELRKLGWVIQKRPRQLSDQFEYRLLGRSEQAELNLTD